MGEGVTYRVNHTVTDASYTEDGKGVISGTYALKFYDAFGEDYTTMPIPHDANCYTVEDALDGLPNTVIPDDSVVCHNRDGRGLVGQGYSLTFRGNPGYLKQLFVDTYLDGDRPTVTGGIYGDLAVNVEIFNEGMTGEFTDYFATQCQNVYGEVKANSVQSSPAAGDLWGAANLVSTFPAAPFRELNSGYYLYLDVVETKLPKQCLGDSDGFEDDNVEVYDWDYGSILSDDGLVPARHQARAEGPVRRLPGRHVLPHVVGVVQQEVCPRQHPIREHDRRGVRCLRHRWCGGARDRRLVLHVRVLRPFSKEWSSSDLRWSFANFPRCRRPSLGELRVGQPVHHQEDLQGGPHV